MIHWAIAINYWSLPKISIYLVQDYSDVHGCFARQAAWACPISKRFRHFNFLKGTSSYETLRTRDWKIQIFFKFWYWTLSNQSIKIYKEPMAAVGHRGYKSILDRQLTTFWCGTSSDIPHLSGKTAFDEERQSNLWLLFYCNCFWHLNGHNFSTAWPISQVLLFIHVLKV